MSARPRHFLTPPRLAEIAGGTLVLAMAEPAGAVIAGLGPEGGWDAAAWVLVGVVLATLAAVALRVLRVSRTLDGIADVVRRARQGDREARADVQGPKAVAELAGEVNRLLDEQRKDEVALRGSEERFRSIADSSPAFIWMAGPDGNCEFVNAAWLEYTGRALAAELRDGWGETLSRYDRERWAAVMREACATRKPFRMEYRRGRRDGAYRWFVDSGTPRYDGDGRFAGFLGSCIDIHERVLSDLRVRRMTDMYSALSQANGAIARIREPKAMLQRVCEILVQFGGFNLAWIGMLDADRQWLRSVAASGQTFDHFDRLAVRFDAPESLADGPTMEALREERPVICNDLASDPRGAVARVLPGGSAIRSSATFPLRENASVTGILAVSSSEVDHFDEEMGNLLELLARNLSSALDTIAMERERDAATTALRHLNATLEDKVAERTRSLEAANRELEAFSYSVSHDLRAPLRSISGFTDLLVQKHGERLDPEARDQLARVKAASTRMTVLINDLLNLARISRIEFKRSAVNLSDIATAAVDQLRESDRARDVDVRIAPGLAADADPGLARIVLVNLLDNAWKFTSGRERAVIEFGRADADGGTAFYVRDNGAGFDMTYADKLFAPFQRLHGEREFPGNGIGLAIVQRIVQRHGGRIWAASEEGVGATFSFTLGE